MRPPWIAFLAAFLCLGPGLWAASPAGEQLAGEQDPVAPKPKATVGGDEGGPMAVTRRPQSAASFTLPEFVITGSGERKALGERPDLSVAVDTSGGLKASPGEQGASKAGMEIKVERESLASATFTARPSYGQLRAAYGLANTLNLQALWGVEQGAWSTLLRGAHASSDGGGPLSDKARTFHQNSQDALDGRVQYSGFSAGSFEISAAGDWDKRFWTRSSLPAPRLERSLEDAGLSWEGGAGGAWLRASLGAQRGSMIIPGLGLAYEEQGGGLVIEGNKAVFGRSTRVLLEAELEMNALAQSAPGLGRQLYPGAASFHSRLKTWDGAQLSLGLRAQWVAGDLSEFQLGPVLSFEQRLGEAFGVFLRSRPSMTLATLRSLGRAQDRVLPDPRLRASKRVLDAELGLNAAPLPELSLELAGTLGQDGDHFLADDPGGSGVWVTTPVKQMIENGAVLRERYDNGAWWQEAEARWRNADLPDLPGARATFIPAWEAGLRAGGKLEAWSGQTGLRYVAARETRLAGGATLPAFFDLSAEIAWAWRDWLSFFVEGRNLLAQPVQEMPDYAEPAPYAGAGAWIRF